MQSTTRVPVARWSGRGLARADDAVAVEAPLAVELAWSEGGTRREQCLAVTMRTPGDDAELALGLLVAEGIVGEPDDVASVAAGDGAVRVELAEGIAVDATRLARHSVVSSSCGVCGKTSLDAVRALLPRRAGGKPVPTGALAVDVLRRLPAELRRAQAAFDETGGIHAAALFDGAGRLEDLREDVGRHNAVDKLVGAAWMRGRLPLAGRVLLLSGRASFELLQKAWVAGVPFVAAIGAPSSLAVEIACEAGITLVGFLRDDRFNVYAGSAGLG